MRIGFLLDSFHIGGSELNAIKVAESLLQASVTVTAFHFQSVGRLRVRYEKAGIELVHVPFHKLFSISAARVMVKINNGCLLRDIQVLHSHCVYGNIISAGIRRLLPRSPSTLASRRWTGYSARRGLHTLNAYAQSAADAVLVNSPSLLGIVKKESPHSNPVYVPNLLPDAQFRSFSNEERAKNRAALGLPTDAVIVGCVARLEPVKDHATLLIAWKKVLIEMPEAHLAIIGTGSLQGALAEQAQTLRISSRVHFIGEVSPAELPHSLLDLSVLTSTDEGFPNSLLEAMAQRIPLVSTNVGGVSDLVTNERNGLLVSKGDAAAIAGKILALLSGKIDRTLLIANGTISAAAHRNDAVLSSLLNTYRQLI